MTSTDSNDYEKYTKAELIKMIVAMTKEEQRQVFVRAKLNKERNKLKQVIRDIDPGDTTALTLILNSPTTNIIDDIETFSKLLLTEPLGTLQNDVLALNNLLNGSDNNDVLSEIINNIRDIINDSQTNVYDGVNGILIGLDGIVESNTQVEFQITSELQELRGSFYFNGISNSPINIFTFHKTSNIKSGDTFTFTDGTNTFTFMNISGVTLSENSVFIDYFNKYYPIGSFISYKSNLDTKLDYIKSLITSDNSLTLNSAINMANKSLVNSSIDLISNIQIISNLIPSNTNIENDLTTQNNRIDNQSTNLQNSIDNTNTLINGNTTGRVNTKLIDIKSNITNTSDINDIMSGIKEVNTLINGIETGSTIHTRLTTEKSRLVGDLYENISTSINSIYLLLGVTEASNNVKSVINDLGNRVKSGSSDLKTKIDDTLKLLDDNTTGNIYDKIEAEITRIGGNSNLNTCISTNLVKIQNTVSLDEIDSLTIETSVIIDNINENIISFDANDGASGQTYQYTYSNGITDGNHITFVSGTKQITFINNSGYPIQNKDDLITYLNSFIKPDMIFKSNINDALTAVKNNLSNTNENIVSITNDIKQLIDKDSNILDGINKYSEILTGSKVLKLNEKLVNVNDNLSKIVISLPDPDIAYVTVSSIDIEINILTIKMILNNNDLFIFTGDSSIGSGGEIIFDKKNGSQQLKLKNNRNALNNITQVYNYLKSAIPNGSKLSLNIKDKTDSIKMAIGGLADNISMKISDINLSLLNTPTSIINDNINTVRRLIKNTNDLNLENELNFINNMITSDQLTTLENNLTNVKNIINPYSSENLKDNLTEVNDSININSLSIKENLTALNNIIRPVDNNSNINTNLSTIKSYINPNKNIMEAIGVPSSFNNNSNSLAFKIKKGIVDNLNLTSDTIFTGTVSNYNTADNLKSQLDAFFEIINTKYQGNMLYFTFTSASSITSLTDLLNDLQVSQI